MNTIKYKKRREDREAPHRHPPPHPRPPPPPPPLAPVAIDLQAMIQDLRYFTSGSGANLFSPPFCSKSHQR